MLFHVANDHKLKVIANSTTFIPQVLCGKDESTWIDRLSREIRALQFLTVQQYLEHPVDGISTQTASALSSSMTLSQAMALIGGTHRGRLARLLRARRRADPDGLMEDEDRDADTVEDEVGSRDEDEEDDDNDEEDDDDNDDGNGSEDHSDEDGDGDGDEDDTSPAPGASERRNGLSIQTSSLLPTSTGGVVQLGSNTALPEELLLVHSWCDSPLLMHGMFDTPTDPARLFEPSTPSSLAFAAGFSMTSLSPLPNPGQTNIFFPPNSSTVSSPMSNVDAMLAQWAFLRQLTDAPNGSGLSQRLVGIMKKYVREDQGSEAGPNHAVHATCAALIWHEGLAEEALEIVKSSQNGVDRRPSQALQTVWKKSQAMRAIFPEEDANGNMLTRSDSFKSVGDDASSKPRLELLRQFSLPVQSPLLPTATLSAVRRARLLLSYYPATVVTKLPSEAQTQAQTQALSRTTSLDSFTGMSSLHRGYFDLLREQCVDSKPAAGGVSEQTFGHNASMKKFKSLTISECVTSFIHSGPDPDLVRKVADERSQLADNRAKGIAVALELLRGTGDESKKADILYKVAESIAFCSKALPMKTAFDKMASKNKGNDKDEEQTASEKTDKPSIDASLFRFIGCHYSNMLSGCTRHGKAHLETLWLDFVKEVVSLGMTWLDQLEKSQSTPSSSATEVSLEYALYGTLSVIGMDYCEGDIDYIVSSGIYLFLSTAAYSLNDSIRRLSVECLERLLHLTCRLQQSAPRSGHEAPAYHADAQNLLSAKSLFRLLL